MASLVVRMCVNVCGPDIVALALLSLCSDEY